jgi:SAM-dependent methyltransferase
MARCALAADAHAEWSAALNKLQKAMFIWRFLAPLPTPWRLHQVARSFMSPFRVVLNHIPHAKGSAAAPVLVDLGCGHGIFLALAKQDRPDLELVGIDLSESKIASARKAFEASGLKARELAVKDIADFEPGSADVITILDVLYLVPLEHWDSIFEKCHTALKPGGVLLVKEMNREKRFKFFVLWLEETLAVKVLRITMGETFTFPPPGEFHARLGKAGFTVEQTPVDRGYHVPHTLWIAKKGG